MENRRLPRSFVYLLYIIATPILLFSQTFPVNEVVINGDNDKHINIAFLSEGFIISEMDQFNQAVQEVIDDLFNTFSYNVYQSYFNVYSIEVPSNESGTDHPGTAVDEPPGLPTFSNDTYFNSTFDYAGTHRLLVVGNTSAVYSVLQDNLPDWDIAFIIVNHEMYGGSGGSFATFSLNVSSSEIAIHELGHSFTGLADEYESGGISGHEAPNATAETVRELVKWNIWIDDTTPIPTPEENNYSSVIGLFEGAVYNPIGWYRPKLNCKMRQLGIPFCEVCSEQTIISVYNLVSTIKSYQPLDTSLTVSEITLLEFVVQLMQPEPFTIKTEWYLDTELVANDTDTFHFDASTVSSGEHEVQVIAIDTTQIVRNDSFNYLMSSITWHIDVEIISGIQNNKNELPKVFHLNQNFPNPFNPTTKIDYQIPELSFVTLKVYDVLGNEISSLVNEEKVAGTYAVEFDGTSLPSGIYFYKLQAGDFVETKKMVLMK